MNNAVLHAVPTEPTRSKAEVASVKMSDGRVVDFVGKRKVLKETIIDRSAETVAVRMDFRNGTTRTYPIRQDMILDFAGHGAEQKYGDELAGEEGDIEDYVLVTDRLHEQLYDQGNWSKQRVGDSMAGTSVLLKALLEFSGGKRTVDQLRAFLKGKSQKEKLALRAHKDIKPIVDRLETEKLSGSDSVDTDSMLAAL